MRRSTIAKTERGPDVSRVERAFVAAFATYPCEVRWNRLRERSAVVAAEPSGRSGIRESTARAWHNRQASMAPISGMRREGATHAEQAAEQT